MSETDQICDILEATLRGPTRSQIIDRALAVGDFTAALAHLRTGMKSHVLEAGAEVRLEFDSVVAELDRITIDEGFVVLKAWDPEEGRFSTENVPVLTLDRASRDSAVPEERRTLGILLDFYFLHLLALVTMRAWDGGEPDRIMERVTDLLGDLQGPYGSGHQFVDDAESLLVLAISHFHPKEQVYEALMERIRLLNEEHRIRFARASTPVLSSHLRWGFEVMYGHDVQKMRADNVGDYPWLLLAVATLMREYVRMRREGAAEEDRVGIVEALLCGVAADPWAFAGRPPKSLSPHQDEYSSFLRLFSRYRDDLLEEFEAVKPSEEAYSPLAMHFNFPNNAMTAMVIVALREGSGRLPFSALLRGRHHGAEWAAQALAKSLMTYAEESPEVFADFQALLVVYDPHAGLASYQMALSTIKKHLI